jgi:rhodanese-related sulfurtransferase
MRSLQVAHFLQQRGFDAVYNVAGGIDAWARTVDPSVPRY